MQLVDELSYYEHNEDDIWKNDTWLADGLAWQ